MKRLLIFLLILAFTLSFAPVISAEEIEQNDKGEEIRTYVEEKIVPILMGVATSIIALLGTLKGVFNALKGLKESKATFDKEQAKIKENSKRELEEIKKKYEEIKTLVSCVPQLDMQIKELNKGSALLASEVANLSEIASLGFSESYELVKSGKAREIVLLANENRELIENEAI